MNPSIATNKIFLKSILFKISITLSPILICVLCSKKMGHKPRSRLGTGSEEGFRKSKEKRAKLVKIE
jgi:hypothetical protein